MDWWQPDFQTTIDAYYRGDLTTGLNACERLLSVAGLPETIELLTRRNLVFYAQPIDELAPSSRAWQVEIPVPEGWSNHNPSLAADGDRFRMILRSGNYTVDERFHFTTCDPEGVFRTTNYLLNLDPDLKIEAVEMIIDSAFRMEPPLFPVAGFEDCRLFRHRGTWWASAIARDQNPRGICQIALLRLDGATAAEMRLLSDGTGRDEKNWMPIVGDEETLRFVYSCFPTRIIRYDDKSGSMTTDIEHSAPIIARDFRGGTQAIPVDGGHLCLVHQGVGFDDGNRVYLHRWVWFDDTWRLARVSSPFIFQERGVEYAVGLARRGDELVISYGRREREAWLATAPLDRVKALLAPPLDAEAVEVNMRAVAARSAQGITPRAAARPSIVSMTLTGNSREIIGDALRSVVDWVEWVLVVDTGVTDDTLRIAREIAGDRLVVRQFPWHDDFAAARNFALKAAAETGAEWAVTLDTDERLLVSEIDIGEALRAASIDMLHVNHASGRYGKERFFRLPAQGQFVGPTHEAFIRTGGAAGLLDGIRFEELGKTPDEYRRKVERDVAILSRQTAEHPDDPRFFYYLGDSLAGLGRHDEAIAAWRRCARLNGWDEEGAWAMYRAAESFLRLDEPLAAIEACAMGMARHAGLAELPWLAAYGCWRAGRPAQAVYWATQSAVMGLFAGAAQMVPRIGFRHPPALWEGPYDILRFAFRAIGDNASADEAERLYHEAKAARERGEKT